MTKTHETLRVLYVVNGKLDKTETCPQRTIYRYANGREVVNFSDGRRTISRVDGKAVLTVKISVIKKNTIGDILCRLAGKSI